MTPDAPSCPVCETSRIRPYLTFQGMELLCCDNCGLVFMSHMPDTRAIYDDFFDGATTGYFAKVDKKVRRARLRARHLARYAKPGCRFLDVGCNGGFFTEAMRRLGFEAHGLDPDPVSVAYAREHYPDNTWHCAFVEDFDPGNLTFGAVYCSEVIEHSADINAFMAALRRLMEPGGVLYLTTPDIAHWRCPRDVTRWTEFHPPTHCVYFNPTALGRLLDKHGFRVIHRRPAFKPGIKLFARRV